MLNKLYQYALSHSIAECPGFKAKRPKAYVCLSISGQFLGIELRNKDAAAVMAPDVGAAANGNRFCNPLIEKAGISLCIVNDEKKDKNIPTKHEFFLSFLEKGKEAEPLFGIAAEALRTPEILKKMQEDLINRKLKSADLIGFSVDGQYLEQSKRYLDWWNQFRKSIQSKANEKEARCLITGTLAQPIPTVPKVSGLMRVGGHTSGDAFLCFDKPAFRSYGLNQSANAAVSEEAMAVVNAALGTLIKEAQVLAGAKMVHWYSGTIPDIPDLVSDFIGDNSLVMGEEKEDQTKTEKETNALQEAEQLIRAIQEGKFAGSLDARYYIMPLSGAGGRMMVRGWYEGSYEELYKNVSLWFEDLQLVLPSGRGMTRSPKLKALCLRLLKPGGAVKWERLDKELSNLTQHVVYAGIHGSPLPDEAASRAIQWLRSFVLTDGRNKSEAVKEKETEDIEKKGETRKNQKGETLVYQLLKVWLIRKQRKEGRETLMQKELDRQNRDVAYLCGRLMAVYSVIQEKAIEDVNAGVIQRYYATAMSSPGMVIGKLSQLSQYHLAKLEKGLAVYYEKMLTEIYQNIGGQKIPVMLTMMQQTEFALGYYQQKADIFSGNNNKEEDNYGN